MWCDVPHPNESNVTEGISLFANAVPGGEGGGVHVPYEQTRLARHSQSRAAQRLPLQSTHGPLTAVLQRRRRRTAGKQAVTNSESSSY